MAHDVFISYSIDDKTIADAMCSTLESKGIRCWIAPRDILPGMDWGGSIIDAIAGSRVMVLVLSSHSNTSSQVRREVERAVNKEVIIVTFRIEVVTLSKSLEYQLSVTHWMDATTPPIEKHLQTLAEKIRQLLPADDSRRDMPVQQTERIAVLPAPAAPPAPAFNNRSAMYLGGALLIGLIVMGSLMLLRAPSNSPPQAITATTPPPASPIPSPRSEENNVKEKVVAPQNQSINNNQATNTTQNINKTPSVIAANPEPGNSSQTPHPPDLRKNV